METNELLRAESGANVKAYLDYAQDKLSDFLEHHPIEGTAERPYWERQVEYWGLIAEDCKQELESRINQIFPR